MENPLMRNPFRSPFSPTTPINPQRNHPSTTRKVVSIPIHFVESENQIATKSSFALKIQKVFRGFLVRKSVRKITAIKTEVDDIGRRLSQRETVDLIKNDSKERLKMNEMLMALLFRLDSIRGVDSGVRDLRKSVIKKAIMLQEKIDAIVAGDQTLDDRRDGEIKDCAGEVVDQTESVENLAEMQTAMECDSAVVDNSVDQTLEIKDPVESAGELEEFEDTVTEAEEGDMETSITHNDPCLENENGEEIVENNDSKSASSTEDVEGDKETEEVIEKQVEEELEMKQSVKMHRTEGEAVTNSLMDRMIEKNEILMNLVTELCEKNALQTQMISSLSQRLENLEKAYKSDRLRRKKKRQATAGTAQGEVTKCGRKL